MVFFKVEVLISGKLVASLSSDVMLLPRVRFTQHERSPGMWRARTELILLGSKTVRSSSTEEET